MAKINAPNESYSGISATIQFQNGVGETDDKDLIGWFREHGYKVEKDSANSTKAKPETNEVKTQPAKPKGKAKKESPEEKQPEESNSSEGENAQTNEPANTETEN